MPRPARIPRKKRAASGTSIALLQAPVQFLQPVQLNFADALFGPSKAIGEAGRAYTGETCPLSPFADFVPVYSVKLVQTSCVVWRGVPRRNRVAEDSPLVQNERAIIASPSAAAALIEAHLDGVDREYFALLLLDTKNRVIGINTVSVGDLCSALVHPREVFKPALLANAASVLLFHNHPSGNPDPSPEDIATTNRLCQAGKTLGIDVVDHVIVGERGRWVSLREKGVCDFANEFTRWTTGNAHKFNKPSATERVGIVGPSEELDDLSDADLADFGLLVITGGGASVVKGFVPPQPF